jgi:hypothetical protein
MPDAGLDEFSSHEGHLHGLLFEGFPDPLLPAVNGRPDSYFGKRSDESFALHEISIIF